MATQEFGARLKELRKQIGLSQRELADEVGINFTYLSKIENGVMPPPSDKVILRLVKALKADKDELLTLAGRIPDDIAQILKNREARQLLRSGYTQKKGRTTDSERGFNIMKNLISFKNLSRVAVPIILVVAIAASLWYSSPTPVRALEVTITPPPSAPIGTTHSFTITVDISAIELVPIQSVNLEIFKVSDPTTYTVAASNLPLNDGGSKSYTSTETGGGAVSIIASSPNDNWGYFSGTGYAIWQGTGYSFGTAYGYGYATGTASITYTGNWTSPSGWPSGEYKAKVSIVATSPTRTETFVKTSSSFTLSRATGGILPGGGGGGGETPEPVVVSPGIIDVSKVVTTTGNFTQSVIINSADGNARLTIEKGTTGLVDGKRIVRISMTNAGAPTNLGPGDTAVADTYEIDAGGGEAIFDHPVELSIKYNDRLIPSEFPEANLAIFKFNPENNQWERQVSAVNPEENTSETRIKNLSKYTVLARSAVVTPPVEAPAPAAFSVSGLTVRPAEVQSKEAVNISVVVANTGGTEGSYTVVLKINGVKDAEKSLTIAAGGSQIVTFSVIREKAGSYSVAVADLSASFTVVAPPVTPPVTPPSPVEIPAPPANWVLIGGIIAAVIVIGLLVYFLWWRRRIA
ncbi:MAG: helix-turn-helix domain-containing protein [Chloroflexi bacterium]|nr:helix-turn-helix domain-containing protein [Chloroflexota bacterium]